AMKKVFNKLEALGIAPELHQTVQGDLSVEDTDLKSQIIYRAATIRQEWEEQQEEYTFAVKKKPERKKAIPTIVTNAETPSEREVLKEDSPVVMERQLDLFDINGFRFDLIAYLSEKNITFVD